MRLTLKRRGSIAMSYCNSTLYNQDTFYLAFLRDVRNCKRQLIVESPFITSRRVRTMLPIFKQLRKRGVQIIINTRDPEEHDGEYQQQAAEAIELFHKMEYIGAIHCRVSQEAGRHR